MRYYIFHHTWRDADINEIKNTVNIAHKGNFACMQYEYGHEKEGQPKNRVSANWNIIKEINLGDVVFLCGKDIIYAFGYAKKHEMNDISEYITLNCQSIIDRKSHEFGGFSFDSYNNYRGIILFEDCEVFYEDLSDKKFMNVGVMNDGWGQRIDVDEWKKNKKYGMEGIHQGTVNRINDQFSPIAEIEVDTATRLARELTGNSKFNF